jgi:hypothetical protein
VDNFISVVYFNVRSTSMTSQFKVQGSFKALMVAATVAVLSMPAMDANAQRAIPTAVGGGRGTPPVAVRPIRPVVPRSVIVVPACRRGGPSITRC